MEFHEMHFFVIMHKMGKITIVIYKLLPASLWMWVMATFLKKFRGSSVNPRSSGQLIQNHWPSRFSELRTYNSRILVSIILNPVEKSQDLFPTMSLC